MSHALLLRRRVFSPYAVGAVGSLSIAKYFLKEDPKKDVHILRGLDWIAKHYDVTRNLRNENNEWHLYYLYELERAAVLYGAQKFGAHDWYAEGAAHLLKIQRRDGAWDQNVGDRNRETIQGTCFAVLFLKRATAPLIVTEDKMRR